ncbi:MAG: class I SAM-dependent methyltransferase [Alphaproteobacteria bacterium]|nr:MAG: class I SAM-dependent methyltransferase [Alphaproteobacteria bacterium]
MEGNVLGLPLEYHELTEYFDVHNTSSKITKMNSFIESLLKKYGVQTVLDMTCGTGSQVFFLTNLGYKVAGSDFSPKLLNIARQKAQTMDCDILFIDGDMRTLKVGEFDAVITIFNAIGHLTKSDFEVAIRNIWDNLKVGGVYVFDIFNLSAMTDEVVHNLKMDYEFTVDGIQIHHKQYSELDRKNGLLKSYDHYEIYETSGNVRCLDHSFTLQIYTVEELRGMLKRNGFEVVHIYENLSIVMVARKH